ncbi:MAG: ribosome maturation factor RimP [Eubacteriales bacterium]|nr:ribosome maturation factor RimP [Eubacteriales bacterium]
MANKTEELAFNIGDSVAEEQGVFLLHVEYKKEDGEYYLRLFIDKDGGVGIDECEKFSRAMSDKLDELDPIKEAYVLEVSSPGADRKLVTEREFNHYIGREVDVKLYAAKNGEKEISGILTGYSDGVASVDVGDEIWDIPKKDAVYIRLSFKF